MARVGTQAAAEEATALTYAANGTPSLDGFFPPSEAPACPHPHGQLGLQFHRPGRVWAPFRVFPGLAWSIRGPLLARVREPEACPFFEPPFTVQSCSDIARLVFRPFTVQKSRRGEEALRL
jgi:hypothetical protein